MMARSHSLRQRILAFVGALIVLSLLGSTVSLFQITEVKNSLDQINRVSVPLGKLLAQMQVDAEVFRRELNRGLGYSHWDDSHWSPRPVPRWIVDVIENEVDRADKLLKQDVHWASAETRVQWQQWVAALSKDFTVLKAEAAELYVALEQKDRPTAEKLYPHWTASLDEWMKQLQWGVSEFDQALRETFTVAENRVSELRTGLEVILLVVVSLSLLLLWLGERALRPLGELTRLAREITRRGLRKEDKSLLPRIPLSRNDEVSQLAREFHHMATALLEREKIVETQKESLEEQNRQLRQMGELQERLRRAESLAAVGRMSAQVAHEVRNPLHSIGLEAELAIELASGAVKQSLQSILASVDRLEKITENYLKLSRLSAGEKSCFNLGDALESVLAVYAPACEEQGVVMNWSRRPGSCLDVVGDRDLIEQVLGNLLRNALQALTETAKPRIDFHMGSAESGRVWLRIEDNGHGIAPGIRERLFVPFVTTRAQGTGLGLSFIKKVLEDHGGTIHHVETEAGACFEFLLPAAEIPESAEIQRGGELNV